MSNFHESLEDYESVTKFKNVLDTRSIITLPRSDFDEEERIKDDHLQAEGQLYSKLSKKSFFDFEYEGWGEYGEDKSYDDYDSHRYNFKKLEAVGINFKGTDRDEIIEKLKELQHEANVLVVKNKFLHRHYIEAMRNTSVVSTALGKFDEIIVFEDTRYIAELDNYSRLRDETSKKEINLITKLDSLKEKSAKAKLDFEEVFENLLLTELEVGKKIKPLKLDTLNWNKQLEKMIESQRNRVNSVAKLRMDYLQLNYKLTKLQSNDLQNLGPELSVLDYEFLLKKKDVYEEKLAEQKYHIQTFDHKIHATAAIIKHVDEESELFTEKVKNETDRLLVMSKKNKIEHSKFVKLAKTRAVTFKKILKLKEIIGLLGVPFLINKMEYDIIELKKIEKKLNILNTKMLDDDKRFFNLVNPSYPPIH